MTCFYLMLFLWIIGIKMCFFAENDGLLFGIDIVPYSINKQLKLCWIQYKWAGLMQWCNMQNIMVFHKLSSMQSVNHFICVTKQMCHVTYSWTYWGKSFAQKVKSVFVIYIHIYIRLKIKPNSVIIRFLSCQMFVLPSAGFELTPLIHIAAPFD